MNSATDVDFGLDRAGSCTVNDSAAPVAPGSSGPWTFSVSSDGSHDVSCSISDLAGNSNSDSETVKIDTADPSITVSHTADGSNGWNVTSPVTETVTASDGGSGLDGAPACTVDEVPATLSGSGPWTFSVSGDGSHSVECSVPDQAGHSNSDSETVKIDTTDPSIHVSHTADGSNDWNVTSPVTETVTASDGGSGLDGAPACTVDSVLATLSGSGPWTFSVSGDGSHSVECSVSDKAGNSNSDSDTVKIDTTPPDTSITAHPNNPTNQTSASFSFTSTEANSTFQCKLDTGAFSDCTSPKTYSSLADGSHTFQVEATDQAGNTDATPATFTWTINTTKPTLAFVAKPNNPTNDNTPKFEVETSPHESATWECYLEPVESAFNSCAAGSSFHLVKSYNTALSDGTYTFHVRAMDLLGNTSDELTYTFAVDTVAPDTSIGAKPSNPSTSTSATFSFSATDPSPSGGGFTFQCRLDSTRAGDFSACTNPKTYTGLAAGSHTFYVRAVDTAGNIDPTPASYTWTITSG